MSIFDRAIDFVLECEGGVSNNKNDSGGLTKFGISQKSYPNLDINNLTREDAIRIYKRDYWNKCGCDELPEQIAFMVFDQAVNQGVYAAIRDLQKAVGVEMDGIIGKITLDAVYNKNVKEVIEELSTIRLCRYSSTVFANPSNKVFLLGWTRRVIKCMRRALG